jgi:thiol-disulfide isomerase/thioredoxin
MPERQEYVCESVNSDSYTRRHMGLLFRDGFSFSGFERDKVWIRSNGRYEDLSVVSGADDEGDGRALCVADFDDDGDADFFVHNIQRERHHLYRNDAATGGFVKVQLQAAHGAPEAVGAVVRLHRDGKTAAQVLCYGSGFQSQNAAELIFGTADAAAAEVSVHWPGRERESFGSVAAGGKYLLVEGTGQPRTLALRTFVFADPAVRGLRVRVGQELPTLPVVDSNGERQSLVLGTRPTLVNLWATYCKTCVAEMRELRAIQEAGHYEVIWVSMDQEGQRERCAEVLRPLGVKSYFCSPELLDKYLDPERMVLPTTLVIEDGRLQEVVLGAIDHWSRFAEATAGM